MSIQSNLFFSRQELAQHSASCYSLTWNPSNDKTFSALESTLMADTSTDAAGFNTNAGTLNAFLYGSNYSSSTSLFPSFDTPESRYNTYSNDFISPLASPIGVLPSRTSASALDGSLGGLNTSLNTAFNPTRRPSSSSSGSLVSLYYF